jgi:hypothetical protein
MCGELKWINTRFLSTVKHLSAAKNLWNFLHMAREQFSNASKIFWIDAICINQGSIPERNHQVSQMGAIYSKATDVLAWQECDSAAIDFLNFLTRLAAERPQAEKDARRIWYRESSKQLQHSYLQFEANVVLAKLLPTLEKVVPKSKRKTDAIWRSTGRYFEAYV